MSTPVSAPCHMLWYLERMISGKFVIYQFSLLVVLMGYVHEGHAQSCSWNWHDPPSSPYIRSVGAPAKFNASVNDILSNSDFVTWKSGTTDLSIEEYLNGAFSSVVNARSFRTRFERLTGSSRNSYILEFPAGGVTLGDDVGSITVTSQGCTTGGTSPAVELTVRYCNLTHFAPEGISSSGVNCGYNCTYHFNCTSSVNATLSFHATCKEDATWTETTPAKTDRCGICDASDLLPKAIEVDSSLQAGLNQMKTFQCVCPTGPRGFTAECQSGLQWNYTKDSIPCYAACNASEVTFASPGNISFLCGVQPFSCNEQLLCDRNNTFDLECMADGMWYSLENRCIPDKCIQTSIDAICDRQYCQHQYSADIACGEPLTYNCSNHAIAANVSTVVCNGSNSFNYPGPLCLPTEVPCSGYSDPMTSAAIAIIVVAGLMVLITAGLLWVAHYHKILRKKKRAGPSAIVSIISLLAFILAVLLFFIATKYCYSATLIAAVVVGIISVVAFLVIITVLSRWHCITKVESKRIPCSCSCWCKRDETPGAAREAETHAAETTT